MKFGSEKLIFINLFKKFLISKKKLFEIFKANYLKYSDFYQKRKIRKF